MLLLIWHNRMKKNWHREQGGTHTNQAWILGTPTYSLPPPHRCPPPPALLRQKTCLRPHSFPSPSTGVEANTFYRRSLPTPFKPRVSVLEIISSQPPAQPRSHSEWSQEAWQRPNRPRQKSRRLLIRWVGAISGKSLILNQAFIIGFVICPCV